MYKFIKEHVNEVKDAYNTLGFLNECDMLRQIKTDISVAIWALTELCCWGLKENYHKKFIVDETADGIIYSLDNENFFIIENDMAFSVRRIKKLIEITTWEKYEGL